METRDKLKFVTDFFKGKRAKAPRYMYMPVKTITWFAETPDQYFDDEDETKIYTAEEVAALENEYYLIILKLIKTAEDIPISEEADKKMEAIEMEGFDKTC